ncbi:hypothetical protein [Actibacterium pelagium]|uniref:hypothetical protein n=1 Tax=Actibacterium pelagium TaxID=2029103 RepID=UPI001177FE84|nr:hypothetical protein [Actibacterium pelagium]
MGRKTLLNKMLRPMGFGVHRLGSSEKTGEFETALVEFKTMIIPKLARQLDYQVQRGPFAGLQLPPKGSWSDLDLFAKLIGSYEQEVFDFLEAEIRQDPDLVINIGASEGFYAVGLKRRLASSEVYTFDIDIPSRGSLQECAATNSVSVHVLTEFAFSDPLTSIAGIARRPFFVVDCEGCEAGVVDMPASVRDRSSFLIELHDLFHPGLSEMLVETLKDSHDLQIASQQSRQVEDFAEVSQFSPVIGAVLLNEFRAGQMQWLYATPKGG